MQSKQQTNNVNKSQDENNLNIEDFNMLMDNDLNKLFDLISVKNNTTNEENQNGIGENIPIALIDNSGSTSQVFHNTKKSILKNEVEILKKIMEEKKYSKCYLMFWNTEQSHKKEPVNFDELDNYLYLNRIGSCGGTDISVAINAIPELWYQQTTNIYIFTDGEVNSDKYKFADQIFNLTKRKANINIITIETNNYSFTKTELEGSTKNNLYLKIELQNIDF